MIRSTTLKCGFGKGRQPLQRLRKRWTQGKLAASMTNAKGISQREHLRLSLSLSWQLRRPAKMRLAFTKTTTPHHHTPGTLQCNARSHGAVLFLAGLPGHVWRRDANAHAQRWEARALNSAAPSHPRARTPPCLGPHIRYGGNLSAGLSLGRMRGQQSTCSRASCAWIVPTLDGAQPRP